MKRIVILISLFGAINTYAQTDIENGKNIFKSRCSSCHGINNKLVGPALKDIEKRKSIDWIIKFVQSSQTLIKNGDANAVKVFNENNQIIMPDHTDLKETDIKNLLIYIEDESKKISELSATQPIKRPQEEKGNNRPLTKSNYGIFAGLGIFVVLTIFVFNVIINAVEVVNNYYRR